MLKKILSAILLFQSIAAGAQDLAALDAAINSGTVKTVVLLGYDLPLPDATLGRLRELDVIALSTHERGAVKHACVALPIAAWAEAHGGLW